MFDSFLSFNGERADPISGHYHLGNGYRAYSPVLMRFTCPDSWSPFGAGGINPYAYCEGDPINRADPSGHMSSSAIVGIVTGAIGIVLGIVSLLSAPVTGGSSIAAWLSTMATVTGLASDAVGIAGAALEERNPAAAAKLGWASLALGVAAMGAGLAATRMAKAPKQAGWRTLAVSEASGTTPRLAESSLADEFIIYSGSRKPGEAKRALLSAHGKKMPKGYRFQKVMIPDGTTLNYYAKEGYSLEVRRATNGIPEVASGNATPVGVVSGRKTTNYLLSFVDERELRINMHDTANLYGADIITPPANELEFTSGDLFSQLSNRGIKYQTIEAVHCRVPGENPWNAPWTRLDVWMRFPDS